ncbi:MAG: RNA polymerase sigma factor [Armatimonadetes bacterium]|nr:RNA polymerase sigma factor [Armatimonadota bacterium]
MLERRLVQRLLSGDERAARRFVDDHYGPLLRFLRYLTGSEEEAVELTQQTFVKAQDALAEFRHESSLRTWLRSIAYHEFTHWRRDRQETVALSESVESPAGLTEDGIVLQQAIDALPDELRETFVLREIDRLSVRETAEVLDVPEGTVKSRCSLAKQRLRRKLASAWDFSDTRSCEVEHG